MINKSSSCPTCDSADPTVHEVHVVDGTGFAPGVCDDPFHSSTHAGREMMNKLIGHAYYDQATELAEPTVPGRAEPATERPIAGPEASFAGDAEAPESGDASEVPASDPGPTRKAGDLLFATEAQPFGAPWTSPSRADVGELGQEFLPGLNELAMAAVRLFQTCANIKLALQAGGKVLSAPLTPRAAGGFEGATIPCLRRRFDPSEENMLATLVEDLARVKALEAFLMMYGHDQFAADFSGVDKQRGWTEAVYAMSVGQRMQSMADAKMQALIEKHGAKLFENFKTEAKGGEATGDKT